MALTTTGNPLVDNVRKNLVRYLVGRSIVCIRSGEVLDADTCVVLVDADGDPSMVLSQEGWDSLPQENRQALAERHNLTPDPATVRAERIRKHIEAYGPNPT